MPSKDPNKHSKAKLYSDEFKRIAVQLVTEQKYSIAAAARAVGVSEPSLRQWLGRHGCRRSRCLVPQACRAA